MKRQLPRLLLTAFLSVFLAACGGKKEEVEGEFYKTWQLADGTSFNAWVAEYNMADERCWIWCDAEKGPVSYRLNAPEAPGEWKPMTKARLSNDEKLTIIPDPQGFFCAAEVLSAGKYTVDYKVGTEEFSAVALAVE